MRKATKIGFIAVFCAAVGLTFPVFNIFPSSSRWTATRTV